MSEDIKAKLLKSDSVVSFSSEQTIFNLLKENEWDTIHGCYYVDRITNKHREIDVLGRQSWEFEREMSMFLRLNLVIEAKTAKDYHLIFSPALENKGSTSFLCNKDWIGLIHYQDNDLREFLKEYLNQREVDSLLRTFTRAAFPDDMQIISELSVEPNPAPVVSSAFRETNSKVEKDLDNSVLWKAFQSVNTAVQSLKARNFDGLKSDLSTDIVVSIEDGDLISNTILDSLLRDLGRLTIYHPIIVIDSRLWVYSNSNLTEKNWVRFTQLDTGGHTNSWIDVVNTSYFSIYIKKITSHYKSKLTKLKGKFKG